MSGSTRYSPELRERAMRMVFDRREEYKSEWATVLVISKLLGMSPETLRGWVRRAQVDQGTRAGLTTAQDPWLYDTIEEVCRAQCADLLRSPPDFQTRFTHVVPWVQHLVTLGELPDDLLGAVVPLFHCCPPGSFLEHRDS